MRLNFLILGAQKSASTYLQYCLSQHPDVFIYKDELAIFEDPDYQNFSEAFIDSLFSGRTERRLGIKRPSSLGRPEVPERIRSAVPDAKLIAVLRNPVDRALSAYFYYMSGSYIPLQDAETGMRNLLEGRYAQRYKRSGDILEFGKYYKYISRYGHFLDSGKLLLIKQEDLLTDRQGSFRRVFDFLEVDPDFQPPGQEARRQAGHYNLISQRIMRLGGKISFRKNETNTRAYPKDQLLLRLIGKAMFFGSALLSQHILDGKRPALSKDCKDALYGYYRDDVTRLEGLTGWDLSSWKGAATNLSPAART